MPMSSHRGTRSLGWSWTSGLTSTSSRGGSSGANRSNVLANSTPAEVAPAVPPRQPQPKGKQLGRRQGPQQFADLVVVGFGLGERVIQDDVDGVIDSHRRVDLRDDDT
jgi:hypothetical protein